MKSRMDKLLIYLHFLLTIKANGSKMINQAYHLKNVFIPELTSLESMSSFKDAHCGRPRTVQQFQQKFLP